MVPAPQRDDLASARMDAGQVDGGFDGLGSAVREEGPRKVARRNLGEPFRRFHLWLGDIEGGGVPEGFGLAGHG